MANFPFLPKDNAAAPESSAITVKKQPKTFTIEDIADDIAPQFPDRSREEIREVMRLISKEIIDTLLSGKDIVFDDGTVYSLDADGRTIWVTPPQNKV
jgi:hypothetical protein